MSKANSVTAMEIKSRLDISQLFWEVDELCKKLEHYRSPHFQLESDKPAKPYRSRLSLSEVTTIVIAFQVSGSRTFNDFYTFQVQPYWHKAFPQLVSYNRFVELMPWSLIVLGYLLESYRGEITGISFVDSTPKHKFLVVDMDLGGEWRWTQRLIFTLLKHLHEAA